MKKTAIILGSTGLTGNYLLKQLLNCPEFDHVIALTRHHSHSPHPKLIEKEIDFDEPETALDLLNGYVFFCCLGTTIKKAGSKNEFQKVDYEYPYTFASLAAKKNVPICVIISAVGANPNSKIFYSRVKGKMESKISHLPFKSIAIIRPSLLTGNRQEFRLGEKAGGLALSILNPLMTGKLKRYRSIPAKNVAIAMKKIALKAPEGVTIYESDKLADIAKL